MIYFHGAKGRHSKKQFFEGYYFKHQTKKDTAVFIPSIHVDNNGEKKAYLQIIINHKSYSFEYPYFAFHANRKDLYIRIKNNIFTNQGMDINIDEEGLIINGEILYDEFTPLNYDIMGPFAKLPFMECNHGVISLRHKLKGYLEVNGRRIDFGNGIGYIEKDWGKSFPQKYIWTQHNEIKTDFIIMLSIATVPYLGKNFTGTICVITYLGKQYRLATYMGARVIKSGNNIVISQGKYLLKANYLEGNPKKLLAPEKGGMSRTIKENILCKARYQLYRDSKLIFDIKTDRAFFEFVE